MSTHTTSTKPKRQHRPLEFKLKLVQLALNPGASLTKIAAKHSVNDNLLKKWVKAYQHQVKRSEFIPVQVDTTNIEPATKELNETACIALQITHGQTQIELKLQNNQLSELGSLLRQVLN